MTRCIDSVLNQTFADFEIILIDDGSPDRSGKICDEYAEKDSRIKVVHKQNGGVSAARQSGLDMARGEYVIHADPDDWIEPDMLEGLYRKAIEEHSDMVICDFFEDIGDKENYIKQQPSSLDNNIVLHEMCYKLHGSCWNKLVRRACFNEYNIRFPEGINYCEDLITNIRLIQKGIRISYLPKAFYHYRQDINPNSLVSIRKIDDDKKVISVLKRELDKGIFKDVRPYLSYNLAYHAYKASDIGYFEYLRNVSPYAINAFCAKDRKLRIRLKLLFSVILPYKWLRRFTS